MFNFHQRRKHFYIGGGIVGALLIIYILFRLWPPTQESVDKCVAVIEQESYYQLEADGKPIAYFADYKDSLLIGGSVSKDSIKTRKVRMKGYWVNRYPIVPSCYGRILTKWENKPSAIVNLESDELHKLLRREFIATDDKLAGFQTQHNELIYFMRVHSVQDLGYNRIADYNKFVEQQMDSLNRVIDVLKKIKRESRLSIKQVNRYSVVSSNTTKRIVCHRIMTYEESGNVILQTKDQHTPINVITKIGIGRATEELAKISPKAEKALNKDFQVGVSDSLGYYVGELKGSIPNGYGKHFGNNGSYYDGHWENGERNGFGIYIAPHEYLQVGEWKDNVFKGERLTYTADRIYGIDISRHQHEKNNRRFNIDWNRLRITHLGTLSTKKIEGKVDYPVSFIYIKSTEGCTVLNTYYAEDYQQARKHGIKVGAYHFFSTTSAGKAQAQYFLNNSRFQKGDLPPVLDVEPTDAQISVMGGPEAFFKHVRDWLTTVKRKTGVAPILYISQMFTKKYLTLAPDIAGDYFVWIARYGEYKPEMKLSIWQLSPDGKVKGIEGDVDINVFNGYKNEYEDFFARYCVK